MSRPAVNIVGVGNILMGDDGVGPAVIEALRRRGVPRGVELYDAGLAASDVLGGLDPEAPLVVVDSLRADGEPGSVFQAPLSAICDEEGTLAGGVSLHELNVLRVLRMEALTGREFRDVTVFGVEPGRLAWGEGLSEPVREAVGKLVERLLEYVGERYACEAVGDEKP